MDTGDNPTHKARLGIITLSSDHFIVLHPSSSGGYVAQVAEVVGNTLKEASISLPLLLSNESSCGELVGNVH